MVLGRLPFPWRPTVLTRAGQGPTALEVCTGRGCFDIFTLICPFSPLFPHVWETVLYRLKYCPKTTNQPTDTSFIVIEFYIEL